MKETTDTERNLKFNSLCKQIQGYQEREHEVRKLLRLLNRDKDSISKKHSKAFVKVYELLIPNE